MSGKLNEVKVMYMATKDKNSDSCRFNAVFASESYDPSIVCILDWVGCDKYEHSWQYGDVTCVDGSNWAIRDSIDEIVDWICKKEGFKKHIDNVTFKFNITPCDSDKFDQLPKGLEVDAEQADDVTYMKDIINEFGDVSVCVNGEVLTKNNIVRFDHDNCLVDYGDGFRHEESLDIKINDGSGNVAGF